MSNVFKLPAWPQYDEDERKAVENALVSGKVNYWTGEQCREFEREYAASVGVNYCISLMNGTVALELPLRMWGIGPGDEVIVTPRSFMASISCVVQQGARPVFADVDRDSGNLTAQTIERVLTPKTKAIVLVHLAGWPCEMDSIMELAEAHGIKVIEDCAQAHGATYKGRAVGSIGHAGSFSFCQDKIITTGGEGGLLTTDDEQMWKRAWAFKDHGKGFDAVYNLQHPPGFRWLCESFGTNWRMTELQAAIGRIQLRKLPEWSGRRLANAKVLIDALRSIPGIRVPVPASHSNHAYYRFYAYIESGKLRTGWSRDRIVDEITATGAPCFSGSCSEVYRERAFDGTVFRPHEPMPVARELGETSLAFLTHPTLQSSHMEQIAETAAAVIRRAVI